MFSAVAGKIRKSTFFEKALLIIGFSIGIIGFWLINLTFYQEPGINWPFLTATFMWIMLIFLIILTDSSESVKEELGIIIREHIEETKILGKIMVENKEEIKLLKNEVVIMKDALKKRK